MSNGGGNLADSGRQEPKTPRGDGNWIALTGLALILVVVRHPKPREGTETWDICCPPGEMLSEVVRTQNPERGRKP
ncbi:Uncharacterised protein [Mycobacterium tuberculosis]|nr:Uncharacterised protein [Mycobacterium tuberculosis]